MVHGPRLTAALVGDAMKNPLESLQNTVVLGFVLTVVMVILIHTIN
jgi:hypothetical protein